MAVSDKILNLLNQFVPIGFAVKGLEKIDPRFKKFFGTGIAAGYGTNELVGYLRSKFQTQGEKENKTQLQERVASGMATPDEAAGLSEIQHSEVPGDILQTGASLGLGALAGAGAAGLLGKGAQAATAMQGLKQKVGQAAAPITQAYKAQEGMATPVFSGRAAASAENALGTLAARANRAKTAPQALQSTKTPTTSFDLFVKNNPEIGSVMKAEIGKGKSPFQAAATARGKKGLKSHIENLEWEMAQPFEGVIAQVFGLGSPQQQTQQPQAAQGQSPEVVAALEKLGGLIQGFQQSKGMR